MEQTKRSSNLLWVYASIFLVIIFSAGILSAQSVGINYTGTAPNSSALLDVDAAGGSMKGLLIPRMTLVQRGTISGPATGLIIYQTDNTPGFYYYNGTAWISLVNNSGISQALMDNIGRSGGTTLIGGTGISDPLILRSTSGAGVTGANIIFQGGTNGSIEIARMIASSGSGGSMTYSYTNPGGSGNRTASITVAKSANLLVDYGTGLSGMVDGSTTAYAFSFGSNNTQTVATKWIRFDFGGGGKVVTEAKWYSDATSQGVWKWQGTNDTTTAWTDIGATFTLGTPAVQTISTLSANTISYRYYRILGVSGTCNWNGTQKEIEFKTGAITGGGPTAYFGIGCTNPTEALYVAGNIKATGTVLASQAACSDVRWKKDFSQLSGSLDKIVQLSSFTYHWRVNEFPDKKFSDKTEIGMKAQEVEKLFPEIIFTDTEGYKYLDYSRLTPILVEALKEQQLIIDKLLIENTTINNRLLKIEAVINPSQVEDTQSKK